ncbi:MAG TPA: glucose-6-phosphate dehydrogenase assembly protein OpcA, partial [Dehalococcoidia bacterium]|nr:glucose-6-phosphate dehydrogenase assembly protein OpcA [Dehalococcoidia bacterium]
MTTLEIVDNEAWASDHTDLESIAGELRRARAAVRSDDDEGVPQDISEAAVLNLVVASSEAAHLDEAAEIVGELAQRHPSRLILFLRERQGKDRLSAQVNAVCTYLPGASRQVCCERVRLEGHGVYADQLHSLV